jgi:ketosteroid isomerase-like protein
MAAVRQFVAGFNSNDVQLAQAACADVNSIIDDFPPHEWTGPGATTMWLNDMARMGAEYGMSDAAVTLDESHAQVIVSDKHAYAVVPVDVHWLQDGAPDARAGRLTLALRDEPGGWRIAALAWAWD